jgi:MurNAc alpha-1-phosphate uridylyltransferase
MTGRLPRTAMVFAAGLGTRMLPITQTLPKPLVEVAGKPIIDHVLDRFAAEGVETAVVNVHHLADQIEAHLRPRTAPRIVISDERALLLDQGGGIKKALPHLGDEPFLVANTDAFWVEGPTSNLQRLAQAWNPDVMDAILLLASTTKSIGVDWPGDFQMDTHGRLTKRAESDVAPFVYSGVGILKPQAFAQDPREVFGLAPFLFEAAKRGRLYGVRLEGLWLHVGTPAAIGAAEDAIERSKL